MRYPPGCPFEELPLELQKSKTLFGYQTLIQYVEEEMEKKDAERGEGISAAISRCIQENILSDFLMQYEAKVKQMILGGRTQEEIMQVRLKCQRAARLAKVPMERAKELAAGLNCRV